MQKILLFFTVYLLCWSTCFAINSYFCTKTNTLVSPGQTLEQVTQACGIPNSIQAAKTVKKNIQEVTQWIYDYKPNLMTVDEKKHHRAMLVVDLKKNSGKPGMTVIELRVNGQPVKQTYFCGKYFPPVQIGYSNQQVWQTCNSPTHAQIVQQVLSTTPITQTTITYKTSPYLSDIKMIFEDSKLTQITSE